MSGLSRFRYALSRFSFVRAFIIGSAILPANFAFGAEKVAAPSPAFELVNAALRAGVAGEAGQRRVLLDQALAADPNFAPARWHSGYVRYDDRWLKPEQVAEHVKQDERIIAYRQRREALVDTADEHRELAVWCGRNKLVEEARVHWAKVLEFDPQDAEAHEALGLQLHNGQLLSREQVVEAKREAAERGKATAAWLPKITRWRDTIERGNAKQKEEAWNELQKLDDPTAIEALEAALASNKSSKQTDARNQLLIQTVGRIQHPDATAALLRRAVLSESGEVAAAACEELKKRPMHSYVPQLIVALPGKLKTKFNVFVLPNGTVIHEHEVLLEGRTANMSLVYTSTDHPADAAMAMLMTPRALNQVTQRAAAIEAQATATDQMMGIYRKRIEEVLQRTTGFSNASDPELVEKQYMDHYGWQQEESAKPTYTTTETYFRGYASSRPADQILDRTPDQSLSPRPAWQPTAQDIADARSRRLAVFAECFPAGTTVATAEGPVAIEQIRTGDRVLTQNAETGELAYKPVQSVTRTPPSPLVRVRSGSHTIMSTIGHPFWIVGQGWQTGKHLQVGDILHTLSGPLTIDYVEESPPTDTYNLIVSESHNYFVGDARFLVHDNSPIRASGLAVPGLAVQ